MCASIVLIFLGLILIGVLTTVCDSVKNHPSVAKYLQRRASSLQRVFLGILIVIVFGLRTSN